MFREARKLLEEGKFQEADGLVANIEAKYATIPWFTPNKPALAAARAQAKADIYEAEAEKLYQEAADLFAKEELFDVKPLVEKLKSDYPQSRPVTDATRKPSFAELEQSTATLGRFITVRQDGQGDFTSIQAAINAAPPNSLIEIQDNGPYNEKIGIGQEGLTVRGMTGCRPIITSVGPVTNFPVLVSVAASRTTMERVMLSHAGAAGAGATCVSGSVTIRSSIVVGSFAGGTSQIEECVLIGIGASGEFNARNSLLLGVGSPGQRTTLENVLFTGRDFDSTYFDCIWPRVAASAFRV